VHGSFFCEIFLLFLLTGDHTFPGRQSRFPLFSSERSVILPGSRVACMVPCFNGADTQALTFVRDLTFLRIL
jgi:hypothetical protein